MRLLLHRVRWGKMAAATETTQVRHQNTVVIGQAFKDRFEHIPIHQETVYKQEG